MPLASELRHALRSLARRPGFTLLAMVTLGLGIGASTAIFSALYRLQIAPLPFATADRLVTLARMQEGQGFFLSPEPAVAEAWQQHLTLLEHVVVTVPSELTLTGAGEPVALSGARVSAELPEMLRESPLFGRGFTAEEAASDARVVLLSEGLWRRRFAADPAVLGRSIQLGGQLYTVIGVMPERFARYSDPFPRQEFWLPYRRAENDHFSSALGLLRAGVTLDAASAELESVAAGLTGSSPAGDWTYRAVRVKDMLGEGSRQALPVLLGAVGFVLLIACANVAGLMLVRLNARRREIALRAALGARQRRILGGLVLEQSLLALGAGVTGLIFAVWSMELIGRFSPERMPLLDTLALDPAVLLFAAALLVFATLVAGVLPALLVLRGDPGEPLRTGGDRVTAGTRTRSLLVTAQIALSLMLLVGAALLVRSFDSLQRRDLGFDRTGALVVELALPAERYPPAQKQAGFADVLEGVRAIPGVTAAAVGGGAPPRLGLLFTSLQVEGSDASTEGISYVAGTAAAPGFLPALGARFLAGRDFGPGDASMSTVIVNRAFVDRFWPGDAGVGRRIRIASGDAPWIEIAGVIETIGGSGHSSEGDDLQVFYPIEWSYPAHTLLVRGDDPLALLPSIRQVIARLDPELPLREVGTLEQRMAESISRERFNMVLLSIFAALALLLSVIGLYGLVAFSVQQRVREVGIRVALGATAASVRALFVARGMRLVAAGLVAGLLGALAGVRLLNALVFGVPVYDHVSFAAAVTVVAAAALLASWIPARRAARVDPVITLRSD